MRRLVKNIIFGMLLSITAYFPLMKAQLCCENATDTCSHSFFRPQSLSQNSMLELALHNYDYYHKGYDQNGTAYRNILDLQITAPFYFISTNRKSTAEYFLPNCNDQISIAQNNTADISSPWLCLINQTTGQEFQSTVELRPRRQVIGGAFKLWVDFGACDNCAWYSNFWASMFVPVVNVRHDLHLKETVITPGNAPGCPTNAAQAFNNATWNYGKLATEQKTKTGVDDIEFKVGYDFVRNYNNHASGYFAIFAPTGRKSQADYLFEPTFGSGGHTGLGAGFNGEYLFYACDAHKLSLQTDFRYAYFLKGKETRSFDLRNGEWSRYLLVVELPNVNQPLLPGTNYLTLPVDVTPGSTVYWWNSLHWNYCCCWDFEAGYSFWWREREKICVDQFDQNVGVFDIATACPNKTTANRAVINVSVLGTLHDQTATALTAGEINSASGQHPTASSSTVYLAGSRIINWCDYEGLLGLGVSYEIAHRKSALSQFGVWLKSSISF